MVQGSEAIFGLMKFRFVLMLKTVIMVSQFFYEHSRTGALACRCGRVVAEIKVPQRKPILW